VSRVSREKVFAALPIDVRPLVERACSEADARGAVVYLVGGPVRDLLLERAVLDVDLMVAGKGTGDGEGEGEGKVDGDGDGGGEGEGKGEREGGAKSAGESEAETIGRAVAEAAGLEVVVHDRFGTVTVKSEPESMDLATLRREAYARPGALPEVAPGTLEEDLHRRDFSVNAMAIRLNGAGRGEASELIDLADGRADLAARALRVLHDRSFHDDPTRALRAARLAARLGFRLSRGSRKLLRDALRDGVFGSVSGDRLRREIEKLFEDSGRGVNPAEALRRLDEWHVLSALEPGLELPRDAVAPLRRLGRELAEPQWRAPRMRPWAAGLCLWLAALPPGLRRRTVRRFSVRGELSKRICSFASDRDGWLRKLAVARGRGAVDEVLSDLDEERLYALFASSPPALRRRIVRWAAEDRGRRSPVSGRDLVELGISGPAVGRVLARIRSAYLDGGVANREEALALARELERRSRPRRPAGRKRAAARAGRPARPAK